MIERIQQLSELGFSNEDDNLKALEKTNFDVSRAIEYLVDKNAF